MVYGLVEVVSQKSLVCCFSLGLHPRDLEGSTSAPEVQQPLCMAPVIEREDNVIQTFVTCHESRCVYVQLYLERGHHQT